MRQLKINFVNKIIVKNKLDHYKILIIKFCQKFLGINNKSNILSNYIIHLYNHNYY